jgi:hypothetical protein
MVVSSEFGLERNSRSLHPLQGCIIFLVDGTTGGLFRWIVSVRSPEAKSKDRADSMSYARVS